MRLNLDVRRSGEPRDKLFLTWKLLQLLTFRQRVYISTPIQKKYILHSPSISLFLHGANLKIELSISPQASGQTSLEMEINSTPHSVPSILQKLVSYSGAREEKLPYVAQSSIEFSDY